MAALDFKLVHALLLGVAIAAAQTPAPSFSIAGTVLDQSGASVPGATVRLLASDKPLETIETGNSGGFCFLGLAAGAYVVEAQHDGFKNATARVRLGPRSRTGLTLTLEVAGITSEISVDDSNGQVSTETSANRDAAAVNSNLMEKLPVFDQDYVARMSVFLDAGSTGTGGSSLVVDGMEASSLGVSASAIQEVRINQNRSEER